MRHERFFSPQSPPNTQELKNPIYYSRAIYGAILITLKIELNKGMGWWVLTASFCYVGARKYEERHFGALEIKGMRKSVRRQRE